MGLNVRKDLLICIHKSCQVWLASKLNFSLVPIFETDRKSLRIVSVIEEACHTVTIGPGARFSNVPVTFRARKIKYSNRNIKNKSVGPGRQTTPF